jgi:hypothetical protein
LKRLGRRDIQRIGNPLKIGFLRLAPDGDRRNEYKCQKQFIQHTFASWFEMSCLANAMVKSPFARYRPDPSKSLHAPRRISDDLSWFQTLLPTFIDQPSPRRAMITI